MSDVFDALLSHLVLLTCVSPLFGAVAVLLAARFGPAAARRAAVVSVLLTGLLALLMIAHYDPAARDKSGNPPMQMVSRLRWLTEVRYAPYVGAAEGRAPVRERLHGPNIEFAVGVDGISLWFVALSAVMMLPVVLCGYRSARVREGAYYTLLFTLQAATALTFAALDVALFVFCLEGMLVPPLFLVGIWGGYERRAVVGRLWLMNLAGSLLVLVGLLGAVIAHHSMQNAAGNATRSVSFSIEQLTVGDGNVRSIDDLADADESAGEFWENSQAWIFWSLLVGFAVKSALVPFHGWLAPAAAQSPTAVRIYLLGLLTSIGCYGTMRFLLPLFPDMCLDFAGLLYTAAAAGAVYASLWTLAQHDNTRLIAGWSVSRVCQAAAGIFSLNDAGLAGAIVGLVGHALTTACLVWIVALMNNRQRARHASSDPAGRPNRWLAGCLCFAALAAIGVPGTAGFAGLFTLLVGVVSGNAAASGNLEATFWLLAGSIILAWALLRLVQRMIWPGENSRATRELPAAATTSDPRSVDWDGSRSPAAGNVRHPARMEFTGLALLFAAIIAIGLNPNAIISRVEPSLDRLLSRYPNIPARLAIKTGTHSIPLPRLKGKISLGDAAMGDRTARLPDL